MLTALILFVLLLVCGAVAVFYKRDSLLKLFGPLTQQPIASQFQIELDRTGERIINRLEMETSYLEQLLSEADDKINTLQAQLQAANHLTAMPLPPTAAELLNRNAGQHAYEQISQLQPSDQQPIDMTIDENTPNNDTLENKPAASDKRRLILAMADQGYSVTEIAKVTGIGKGEIILLLQLNKK